MRSLFGRGTSLRFVVRAALLGAAYGCGEAAIDPERPGVAHLAVAPVFPASSRAAGLLLDQVQLVVVRLPAETLLAGQYPFPASDRTLPISEPVPLTAESERLQVSLIFLAGTTPLFSGTSMVEVHVGPPRGDPIALPVTYVGPGGQAATLRLAPRDTVLSFGATLDMRAAAFDAQGAAVPGFYLSWWSSDPLWRPDPSGVVTAGSARGTFWIGAVTPTGVRDSTTVTVAAPPAQLLKTGGDAQSAPMSGRLPLPLEVEVRGSDNLPVAGVAVSFGAPSGGSVDSTNATTGVNGRARTGATLGPAAGPQSFTATVAGVASVSFGATATAPAASFAAAAQTVPENAGTATIVVQLSSAAPLPVTVPFSLTGTAASPADYAVTGPLVIPAGNTAGSITVSLVADGVAEPDETVILTLGAPTNAVLGTTTVHTLTIAAQLPTVAFTAASQSVGEGVGTATITVQLSTPSALAVTVPFTLGGTATTPADYTIGASPLTIPAGSTTAGVTVTVVADALAEPGETVIVTLGAPTNATLGAITSHTVTILGQQTSVSFTAASQTVGEGAGTATVTAQLSGPSTAAVTLPFTVTGTATAGADFTITTSPLVIPAGSTSSSITVSLVADGVAESDETVIVTLGTPTDATLGVITSHTVTILAQQPSVSFTAASQTVGEGAGAATITAQLSGPSTSAVTLPFTVTGTATAGTDFSITASPLVIPAGSTSGSITITPVNDALVEPDETVIVTLGTPTNATLGAIPQHTLTIKDNDVSLTVVLSGGGAGTVATPPGFSPAINCTTGGPVAQCTATYQSGTLVSLVATPVPTSEGVNQFEDWSGTGTGFTCTTSTTCTVLMDQSRQVTARFSLPGTLTFVPSAAGFTMVERGSPPTATTVSAMNTGERQLLLDATIPVTYVPAGVTWLDAKIDRLAIDTLTPATLTLTVLPAASSLAFGTYQASVIIRDNGLQRSWTLPVTLTISPPPAPPVISNIVVSLIQLNDAARCTLGTPAASSFRITFDYTDPNGNGPTNISQAGLNISYLFRPQLDSGGFTNYTYMSTLTGSGSSGSANTTQCYRFGTNTSVDVTMTIQDQGGLRSTGATTTIQKPSGSN